MGNNLPLPQNHKKDDKKDGEKKITKKPELMSMQLGKKRKKKEGCRYRIKTPHNNP